ncbi:MAG: alanine racemase [Promethearchaeota archaeon]
MPISYELVKNLFSNEQCPLLYLDLDAFDKNLEQIGKNLPNNKKIRIGTKSIRVPKLIKRCLEKPFVQGVLTFHANEFKFLQENFQVDDFLLAYPIYTKNEAILACQAAKRDENAKITLMVDNIEHLKLLGETAYQYNINLYICIDVNMAINFMGIYAGARRSPLNSSSDVLKIANEIKKYPNLIFRGIMGYEAQNASLGDDFFLYRLMKRKSRNIVNHLRQQIVSDLKKAGYECEIVNGGGSGCYQETAQESSITEVGLGSALFKSYIFDKIISMNQFEPSLYMVLRIVRFPNEKMATAFSGGYYSSATGNPPKVFMPESVKPLNMEGFGEVQTPFKYNKSKIRLKLGDPIVCRLAKAGEPLERFNQVYIISNKKIKETYQTYRGYGLWLG